MWCISLKSNTFVRNFTFTFVIWAFFMLVFTRHTLIIAQVFFIHTLCDILTPIKGIYLKTFLQNKLWKNMWMFNKTVKYGKPYMDLKKNYQAKVYKYAQRR